MKLSDLENAKKAESILTKVRNNIKTVELFLDKDKKIDGGGIEGHFDKEYMCYISRFRDGSGECALDLSGCYVGEEVYTATLRVLQDQEIKLMDYLESIGVIVY